jgi:HPt (histidine-containing phosphotransfer) domain-containing protein
MNIPPVNPPSLPTGASGGPDYTKPSKVQDSPQSQADADFDQIDRIAKEIQKALAQGDSPQQIQNLVKSLQQYMNDLKVQVNNIKTQDPNLGKVLDNLLQEAQDRYDSFSKDGITPTSFALFLGTCDTAAELNWANMEKVARSDIDVAALEDQNQLSALANALSLQLQSPGGDPKDILTEMQTLINKLTKEEGGNLTIVGTVAQDYDDLKNSNPVDPNILSKLQNDLSTLCNYLVLSPEA